MKFPRVLAGLFACVFGIALVAAPVNDHFTNSVALTGSFATVSSNNYLATAEPGEPFHAGSAPARSVWYHWVAPSDGCVRIEAMSTQPPLRLAVYEGETLETLRSVGFNPANPRVSLVDVTAGETYRIAIDSAPFGSLGFTIEVRLASLVLARPENRASLFAPGEWRLEAASTDPEWLPATVEFWCDTELLGVTDQAPHAIWFTNLVAGPREVWLVGTNSSGLRAESHHYVLLFRPWNDPFQQAYEIPSVSVRGTFEGDNTYATAQPGEPMHGNVGANHSLWWTWVPAYSGTVTFRIDSSAFNSVLAMHRGDGLTNLVALGMANRWPLPRVHVTAGTRYYFALDSTSSWSQGTATWSFEQETLFLSAPEPGARLPATHPVTIRVENHETDHPFTELEFLVNGDVMGHSSGGSLTFDWVPQQQGTYSLSAQGTNSLGELRRTPPVQVQVVPANDDFEHAIVLAPEAREIHVVASNFDASAEPGEPMQGPFEPRFSVWWRWTPEVSGQVECSATSTSGWVIPCSVFTGTSLDDLELYAHNYSGFEIDLLSTFAFEVVAGTEYFIVVDNPLAVGNLEVDLQLRLYTLILVPVVDPPWVAGETIELEVIDFEPGPPLAHVELLLGEEVIAQSTQAPHRFWFTPLLAGNYFFGVRGTNSMGEVRWSRVTPIPIVPPNDNFLDAIVIPGVDEVVRIEGSNVNATHEVDEPNEPWALGSVWYSWVPPYSGAIHIAVGGGDMLPMITVFQGTALANLVAVPVEDYYPSVIVRVTAGEQYYIAVDASWESGSAFSLTFYPPASNDDFANALWLTGTDIAFSGSNMSSQMEEDEPETQTDGSTIWWRWTAPATGDLRIHTGQSVEMSVETTIVIGENLASLRVLAGPQITSWLRWWGAVDGVHDLVCRVREGDTYHIRLAGRQGEMRAHLSFVARTDVPPNDDFANRIVLQGTSHSLEGSNSGASIEPGEPVPSGDRGKGWTVWWSYICQEDGVLEILKPAYGQQITVWKGATLEELSEVGFALDQYRLLVAARAGDELQLAADSTQANQGTYTYWVQFHAYPPNDAASQPQSIEGDHIEVHANNTAAGRDPGEALATHDAAGKTLWYTWVAPATGRATVSLWPYFARVAVYQANAQNQLLRAQVDTFADLAFLALAGTRYYLQLDSSEGDSGGLRFTLQLERFIRLPNDDFADAIFVDSYIVQARAHFHGATSEFGEPEQLDGIPFKSVWWTWQAPFRGEFTWHAGSSFHPEIVLAFYQGSSVDGLNLVVKGTRTVVLQAHRGVTYAIAMVVPVGIETDAGLVLTRAVHWGGPSTADNLLRNPSFEGPPDLLTHWTLNSPWGYGGYVNSPGAAHGQNWIVLPAEGEISQDISTIPGNTYQVELATFGEVADSWTETAVDFGNQRAGVFKYFNGQALHWRWATFTAIAQDTVTRVTIRNISNSTGIDALSVVSLDALPTILTSPASRSAYLGSTVSFLVGASGPEPLQYQWSHNGVPIPGATSKLLVLSNVRGHHAGQYQAEVRNLNGAVLSGQASLVVLEPQIPEIVLQPWGDTVVAGEYHAFVVVAEGAAPLTYQWFKDGEPLPGATNRVHVIPAAVEADAGSYHVVVTNLDGVASSMPATLKVQESSEPGVLVWLANWHPEPEGPNFLVFDVDQSTRLSGNGFVAQIYAGPTPDRLRPCGLPSEFLTDAWAGRIAPRTVFVTTVRPGGDAFVQVRAWEASHGATYEESRARGGRFGRSGVLHLRDVPAVPEASWLAGLETFSLNNGLPEYFVGRIELANRLPDGTIEWRLFGQANFQYLIERSENGTSWSPMLQFTVQAEPVLFRDPHPSVEACVYYRARILD
jgi:hypothetical protein